MDFLPCTRSAVTFSLRSKISLLLSLFVITIDIGIATRFALQLKCHMTHITQWGCVHPLVHDMYMSTAPDNTAVASESMKVYRL